VVAAPRPASGIDQCHRCPCTASSIQPSTPPLAPPGSSMVATVNASPLPLAAKT
jgi:hypothetical protein